MKTKKLLLASALGPALVVAFVCLLSPSAATAAPVSVFVVDVFYDGNDSSCSDGDCSLREAIDEANYNGQSDKIVLGAGTYVLTDTTEGDLEIRGGEVLTITGVGPGQTTIDATGLGDRAIRIQFGSPTVVISGVTVTGGDAHGVYPSFGGGIYAYQAELTLINTVIVSNIAQSAGGVYLFGGSATLTGVQIISNTATSDGGGLWVDDGVATLIGGVIAGNTVTGAGGGVAVSFDGLLNQTANSRIVGNEAGMFGGGLFILGQAVLGGKVADNTAETGGGAYVYLESAVVTLTAGSAITHNTATWGGGLCVADAQVTMEGGRIANNTADSGGGVYVDGGVPAFAQTGGLVVHNEATYGGGVYVYWGIAVLSGGQVVSNTADREGGGVYVKWGDAVLSGGQVVSNTAGWDGGGVQVSRGSVLLNGSDVAHNAAGGGGGVSVHSGSAVFISGRVVSNTAYHGGGVYMLQGSATLSGGQIISNTAIDRGGGVCVIRAKAVFTQTAGSVIAYNTADEGGGVYVWGGRATLSGGQIVSNTAIDGGGVYIYSGTATLSGGSILSNTAGERGGGVFLDQEEAVFTQIGGIIGHNVSQGAGPDEGGGGVYVDSGSLAVTGGEITGNAAPDTGEGSGGGVYVSGGSATLNGTQVTTNTARHGGGVYVYSGTMTLRRTALAGNAAAWTGGGAHNYQGSLTLLNTTVSGNDSAMFWGGVYNISGTTMLTYSTVASNMAIEPPSGVGNKGGTLILQNTIIAYNGSVNCGGSFVSNGHNIEDDDTCSLGATGDITGTDPLLGPLLEDRGTLIHPLLEGSPAINAGTCLTGVTTVDQRGRPRLVPCDIGAFEWRLENYLPILLRSYAATG